MTEKTCAATYASTLGQPAIKMKPMVQISMVMTRVWGRPQVSMILANTSLDKPPNKLEMMPVTAVREWAENSLVTKGLRLRVTTSCVDVMK